MRLFSRSSVVSALIVIASACGSATGSTAVSVGGVDYSESDLRHDLAEVTVDGTVPADTTNQWLNSWIFFTAIELELEQRGIVPTDGQLEQAVLDLQLADPAFDPDGPMGGADIRRAALRLAVTDWVTLEVPDAPPVETDPDDVPNMLCSNHILVETEAEAVAVLDRLAAGEVFGALAIELSIDPGSGSLGGGLGCVAEGSFVPEFEAAAYAAAGGEVVGPVASAFGFHVIEVLSVGPATSEAHPNALPAEIDGVIASVATRATAAAQAEVDAARGVLLDDLQSSAIAEYADTVSVASEYGTWDAATFLVVAPGQDADPADPAG